MELVSTQLAEMVNSNIEEYEFPTVLYDINEALIIAERELYDSDAYKKVQSLKEQIKDYEKNRKAFENMIIEELGEGGIMETKTHFVYVKGGNTSSSVEVQDVELVPEEFIKITKDVKKVDAGAILRRGGSIPGLSISFKTGAPKLVVERKEMEIINAE